MDLEHHIEAATTQTDMALNLRLAQDHWVQGQGQREEFHCWTILIWVVWETVKMDVMEAESEVASPELD